MIVVGIDVAKHNNLQTAFTRAMQRDPDKVLFIGSAPEYERRARESGHLVKVLPAGVNAPAGTSMVDPLP